jgi:ADP-ribose pyrophosphatase
MCPGQLTYLGGIYLAPGYSTEYVHIYLAQDLSPAPLVQDEDEDIKVKCFSLKEIRELMIKGEFNDSKTLAGLFLAFEHLGFLTWDY